MYLTLCGRLQWTIKLQNVLQLNFYYHIFIIVLLQSFVTVVENLYCEQFLWPKLGVILLPDLQKTTRFCPKFQPSSYTCVGFIAEKIQYVVYWQLLLLLARKGPFLVCYYCTAKIAQLWTISVKNFIHASLYFSRWVDNWNSITFNGRSHWLVCFYWRHGKGVDVCQLLSNIYLVV
jgi:hypothetical protein